MSVNKVSNKIVGDTAFHIAVTANSHIEIIAVLLLENGASVTIKNKQRESPLQVACTNSWVDAVALMVKQPGAEEDITRDIGFTLLQRVCMIGDSKIAQLLLNHGANVHCKDKDDYLSMLHFAVEKKAYDLVQLLLAYHIKVNEADLLGRTALHIACRMVH